MLVLSSVVLSVFSYQWEKKREQTACNREKKKKIWTEAEQIGSLEHAVKRRKSKKEAQKMRAVLQMAAGEGKGKRLDVESEHSWSSV